MIELHEDEYSTPALSDRSMRLVALLLGSECATKLLYRGNAYARLDITRNGNVCTLRTDTDDADYVIDLFRPDHAQKPEDQAEAEEVSTLAHSG